MGYTYVISDIHGASRAFHKMLKKIELDLEQDVLIIDGDIVDRGKGSLGLFFEIMEMRDQHPGHVLVIKGNHELFLEMYMKGTLPWERYSSENYGGLDTIRELEKLSGNEKEKLMTWLEGLPIYKVVDSPVRGELVITHTGLHYSCLVRKLDGSIDVIRSIEQAYSADPFQFLICGYIQREAPAVVIRDLDKCLLVGHVPTMFIADSPTQGIWLKNDKVIMIDCGSSFGGKLGCIRLEDEKIYYT